MSYSFNQPRALAETLGCSLMLSSPPPKLGSLTRSCLALSFSSRCISHCSVTYSMNFCPFTTNAFECSCSHISILAFNSSSNWDQKQGHVNYFKFLVWSPKEMILPKNASSLPRVSLAWLQVAGPTREQVGVARNQSWDGSFIIHMKVGKGENPEPDHYSFAARSWRQHWGKPATLNMQCTLEWHYLGSNLESTSYWLWRGRQVT